MRTPPLQFGDSSTIGNDVHQQTDKHNRPYRTEDRTGDVSQSTYTLDRFHRKYSPPHGPAMIPESYKSRKFKACYPPYRSTPLVTVSLWSQRQDMVHLQLPRLVTVHPSQTEIRKRHCLTAHVTINILPCGMFPVLMKNLSEAETHIPNNMSVIVVDDYKFDIVQRTFPTGLATTSIRGTTRPVRLRCHHCMEIQPRYRHHRYS